MMTVKITTRHKSQAEVDADYLRLRDRRAGEPLFTNADAARQFDIKRRLADVQKEHRRCVEWARTGHPVPGADLDGLAEEIRRLQTVVLGMER